MLTHTELVLRAEKWLKSNGCNITMREIRAYTRNGECPDVIGWVNGKSVLIECKVSRSDFLSDKKKNFRRLPLMGMGDNRIYFCPPKIISEDDLPSGWGLAWCLPKSIKRVANIGKGRISLWKKQFEGHKLSENQMLLSALRRLQIRGHFDEIYDGLPDVVTLTTQQTENKTTTKEGRE